ncbi:hypothetical protein QN277_024533 [Acacia crassicarpa]|uniref:Uncharacterized protein n=1 Tax=Acacia crassicarpa TaxID=499986 RepID=A0AAE1K7S7_9FABA|nr:hypothetical protein QN277_024533 [Acacia crassicarpa]
MSHYCAAQCLLPSTFTFSRSVLARVLAARPSLVPLTAPPCCSPAMSLTRCQDLRPNHAGSHLRCRSEFPLLSSFVADLG